MTFIDNLEQIGHERSGSVTQIPAYTPDQNIGPVTDFARDFHAKGRVVGINATPGIREELPNDQQDSQSNSATDLQNEHGNLGTPEEPAFMRESPASDFTTLQQVVVAGGAQRIVQAKSDRRSLVIMNVDTLEYVYIGPNSGVVTTSGFPLVPGAAMPLYTAGDVWACSNADVKVAIIETMGSSD